MPPSSALTLSLLLFVACGGESTRRGTGGECPKPASETPDTPPFEPPPLPPFELTFRNRCSQIVWPAWRSAGGLDNTVVDPQIWLPLVTGSNRTVTAYGVVRDIAFWGRTGCSFDRQGNGACETGDCGGFICPTIGSFALGSATVFAVLSGFQDTYNVGLRVEGSTCGDHECVTHLRRCDDALSVRDACGNTIGCGYLCDSTAPSCCSSRAGGCSTPVGDTDSDGLVITFCP